MVMGGAVQEPGREGGSAHCVHAIPWAAQIPPEKVDICAGRHVLGSHLRSRGQNVLSWAHPSARDRNPALWQSPPHGARILPV